MSLAFNNNEEEYHWSYFRYSIFKFCERYYYLHYYGADKGWEIQADEKTRKIYFLKQLITPEEFINREFHNIFRNFSSSISSHYQFKKVLFSQTLKQLNSMRKKEWLSDPKSLCITSFYQGKETFNDIRDYIFYKIDKLSHEETYNTFKELSCVPFINVKHKNDFIQFTHLGMPIIINPLLVYTEHERNVIINILLESPQKSYLWSLNMSSATFYFSGGDAANEEKQITRTIYINDNNCINIYAKNPIGELINLIVSSSKEMKSRLTYDLKAYPENFLKTDDFKKCSACKFNKICST